MKLYIKILLVSFLLIFLTGCPEEDNQPDGKNLFKGYLYYSNADNVYRIEMNTLKAEKLFSFASYPDIRENNKILILNKNTGTNKLIYTDIRALNQTTILAMDGALYSYNENIHNPRLSYDNKYIAYNGGNSDRSIVYIIDANTGELKATIGDYGNKQPYKQPNWAPDGSLYVLGWPSMNEGIYKVSQDFKTIEHVFPNITGASYPIVSPDGTKIAFVKNDQLWTMNIDGTEAMQYNLSNERFSNPTWSPDSKFIAASGKFSIFVFDLENNTYLDLISTSSVSPDDQMCWVY